MLKLIIFAAGFTQLASAANMRIYGNTTTEFDEIALADAAELLKSAYYNISCDNILYTFGYQGKVDGNATQTSIEAMISFICKNVFLMDWSEEASSTQVLGEGGVQLNYLIRAIPEIYVVGEKLGRALIDMSSKGLDLTRTHLVGHSLGAHLLGNSGRYVNIAGHGQVLQRITGLDPAGPLFEGQFLRFPPLDKTCAKFVDCIHTDPGGFGINASHCTADFWPNFGNFITGTEEEQVQPGCSIGDYAFMSIQDLCSHDRSWKLMNETAYENGTLLAGRSPDYYKWAERIFSKIVAFGYNTDTTAEGDFYLVTNGSSLYGKREDGLHL